APTSSLFTPTAPSSLSPLSLHDALPISRLRLQTEVRQLDHGRLCISWRPALVLLWGLHMRRLHFEAHLGPDAGKSLTQNDSANRSEEHTSELQSRFDLVCRLLLEKKKV